MKIKYNYLSKELIINENNKLNFLVNDNIEIIEIEYENEDYLKVLIDKMVVLLFYLKKNFIYFGNNDLSKYHFKKCNDYFILLVSTIKIRRFVRIGDGKTGPLNSICDVHNVKVGHSTIDYNDYNTGCTIISPHEGNIFREKVVASSYVFNGFGKSTGLIQIEELGTIESKIVLTSTLNVGKMVDASVEQSLKENEEIGISTGTVNPVVLECNDSGLNKSRDKIVNKENFEEAINSLSSEFLEGDVGAGKGMVCHGFKGGIGSSSRIVTIDENEYTIAILVNSNFGSANGKDLIFKGKPLGKDIEKYLEEYEDKGSIVGVFVTDLPLNERQIKRVLKRIEIGIGRTGSYGGNGSGDVFIGFSTSNKVEHFPKKAIKNCMTFNDDYISLIFKRTVEMTEEAVLNSLLFSHHTKGYLKEIKALGEVNELYYDYLDEVIDYEI